MSNLQTYYHFKLDYQKVDQHTGGKWLIHGTKRRKDNHVSKRGPRDCLGTEIMSICLPLIVNITNQSNPLKTSHFNYWLSLYWLDGIIIDILRPNHHTL